MNLFLAQGSFAVLTTVSAIMLGPFLADQRPSAQTRRVRWYAVHEQLNARGQSLNLGEGPQSLLLKNGWSCTVEADLNQNLSSDDEARVTVCKKGTETFEFSVQCEPSLPKYHTQIRFRTSDKRLADFIEVGCELTP